MNHILETGMPVVARQVSREPPEHLSQQSTQLPRTSVPSDAERAEQNAKIRLINLPVIFRWRISFNENRCSVQDFYGTNAC